MTHEEALAKVRKLLALGESDNEHEAALAVARAQAIMEEHDIAEADVDGGGAEDEITEAVFGIPGSHRSGELGKKSTWQGELSYVIAKAHGCAAIWRLRRGSARLVIAGRPRDVAVAIEIKDFCHREIDRLTAKYSNGKGRSWGVSFRMGCVEAIRAAINEEREALHERMRDQVSETALTVYDDRHAKAYASFGQVRKSRANNHPNLDAWMAGRAAGQHVWSGTKKRVTA